MSHTPARAQLATHTVTNQPPTLEDIDLWGSDLAVRSYARQVKAEADVLAGYGAELGRLPQREAARAAEQHPPQLRAFDAAGRRLDEVLYHPAYHQLMQTALGAGYAACPWEGRAAGHATHAAMVYLTAQIAPGLCASLSMNYAAIPALQADEALFADWVPKLTARSYDPATKHLSRKASATLGLAMTEKQSGSDLRATTTRAERDGTAYRLTGHKWFCSAPMSDGFLTLAQAEGGLSCFLVPRWREDARNPLQIPQLKTCLGNRASGTAELELQDTHALVLGAEGQGLRIFRSMVPHIRLDAALASTGLMRASLSQALHWVTHRSAFEARLIDQPLMRCVLADLVLDWEGMLALGMHVAHHFDGPDARDRSLARLGASLAKFLASKLAPGLVAEAMEAMGGQGYVEDTDLPRFYRAAPLASLWEGTSNVLCLEILNMLQSDPQARDALSGELGAVAGEYRLFDDALKAHIQRFPQLPLESEARWYAESLASLLTGSVLIRHAPAAVAEGYIATRLAGRRGRIPGAVQGLDDAALLGRLTDGGPGAADGPYRQTK